MPDRENLRVFILGYEPEIKDDPDCEDEINSIVERSGKIVPFRAAYNVRLKALKEHREQAPAFNRQWFEKLKRVPEASLYSMHMASIDNLRILYVIGKRIILLCAFKEKEERGKKTESYVQFIPVAIRRLKRYKEEL